MTRDEAEKAIQEKLSEARQLLHDAGGIAELELIDRIDFMGMTFEPNFGWFSGEELELPSELNPNASTVGAEALGGWQSSSWCSGG